MHYGTVTKNISEKVSGGVYSYVKFNGKVTIHGLGLPGLPGLPWLPRSPRGLVADG